MTTQDVFDTVVSHLREQGERSIDHSISMCRYRSLDGRNKCAVGCLISDEKYHEGLEGHNVTDDIVIQALPDCIGDQGIRLLKDLQDIHDDDDTWEWEMNFERTAKKYGIDYGSPLS